MKIIIPLQTCSTRVPKKNIIEFYNGLSLFDIKVAQLLQAGIRAEDIYVSSESYEVDTLCREKNVNFLLRDKALTGNEVKQPDLISGILSQIDLSGVEDVMWVQVTNPLFNDFSQMLVTWNEVKEEYDSMVAVKKFKGHLLDSNANPINYAFGHWHKVSQKLPTWYEVLWACFILKKEAIQKYNYHIGVNPYLFVSNATTVDIDTPDDFRLASEIYSIYKKNK